MNIKNNPYVYKYMFFFVYCGLSCFRCYKDLRRYNKSNTNLANLFFLRSTES